MITNTDYDVLIIGAGPAGENVADIAQRGGLRTAVIERELVGGECSYWACMPSKALLRPGEALRALERVPGARAASTGDIDLGAALRRRDSLAARWDDSGQVGWLESVGVDLIRGHGRLAGVRLVDVEDADGAVTRYEAGHAVVIATGTGAAIPPVPGLSESGIWNNRQATTADEVPGRLLVVGGGVVGVELGQAWHDFGAHVTIVEMMPTLLPREEPFAGRALAAALEQRGIVVHTDAELRSVDKNGDAFTGTLADGTTLEADEVLVAVGRRPLTGDVGLEHVGFEPGSYIEVDDHLVATGVEGDWLYAVGDANGRALLTHTGKYQARIAGAHLSGRPSRAWSDVTATPRVVFTDPHVAAVGYTEQAARAAGLDVHTVRYDLGHVAGAAALGQGVGGPSQLVIDARRQVIVGATFVGPGAGELLHAATIAIVGEVPLSVLWHATPAFPTLSEIWLRFLEAYRDEHGAVFD